MSNLINKQIIKLGNLIENYLVGFPQYLDVKKDSTYKLVIDDGSNRSTIKLYISSETTDVPNYISFYILGEDFSIDWGDNTYDQNINSYNLSNQSCTHRYDSDGEYYINIYGDYNYFRFRTNKAVIKILKLGNKITSIENSFADCINLSALPNEPLNDHITSCSSAFANCSKLSTIPLEFTLPTFCEKFDYMFSNTSINEFLNNSFSLPPNTLSINYMFSGTKIKYIPKDFFEYCSKSILTLNHCFSLCYNLINVEEFNPENLTQISSILGVFNSCPSIKKLNKDFNIHKNITSLASAFYNCSNLKSIGKLHTHLNINNLNYTFYDCKLLNININDFLNSLLANNCNLSSTFYNCEKIYGYIPAWYLWKSPDHQFNNSNTFSNCTNINNYNSIPLNWGGTGNDNSFSYFQIKITNLKYFILPFHRYINNNQPTNYKFKINYGDNNIWYDVDISPIYIDLWIKDSLSIFNYYPKTVNVIYKDLKTLLLNSEEEQDIAYLKLFNLNNYILRNIIHKYKKPGNYIISISGTIDDLFVHEKDLISNSYLTKIYSILNLQLKTFDHAFCNAINLESLPNETLSTESNVADYMFYLNDNYKNKITEIPPNFILSNSLSSVNFMFYNFFTYNYVNTTNGIFPTFSTNNSSAIGMFYNCVGLTGTVPSYFYNNSRVDLSGCFFNCFNLTNYKELSNLFLKILIIDILNLHLNPIIIQDFDTINDLWQHILSTNYFKYPYY